MLESKFSDQEVIEVQASSLKPHPLSLKLYDERDDTDLEKSILEEGILQPLIINRKKDIAFSGRRRLKIAKKHRLMVPCVVRSYKDEAIAIVELNRYRVKTPSEIWRENQVLIPRLSKISEAREKSGKSKDPMSELTEGQELAAGDTVRKEIAKRTGVSEGYLSMLKTVMESKRPTLIERVNKNLVSVSEAYRQLTKIQTQIPEIFIGAYFAGKQQLAARIIELIPPHHTYIEPFGGYASVLLNKERSEVEIYNDTTKDLVNLMLSLKDHHDELISHLAFMPWSRDYYRTLIDEIKSIECKPIDVLRAAKWWFTNEMTFSAMSSDNHSQGNWRHSATRNIARSNRDKIYKLLRVWPRLLDVQIENKDFTWVLNAYDNDESVEYIDPPYYRTDDALGISWKAEQHKALAAVLSRLNGKWILSYNDHPEIRKLYKGRRIIEHTLPKRAPIHEEGLDFYTQLIITNFK